MNPSEFSQIRRRGAPAPAFETSSTTYSYPTETFESSNMPIQSNSGRDRTMEFANTVRSLKGRTFNQQMPMNGQRSKNEVLAQQNREFMTIAANIGKNLAFQIPAFYFLYFYFVPFFIVLSCPRGFLSRITQHCKRPTFCCPALYVPSRFKRFKFS